MMKLKEKFKENKPFALGILSLCTITIVAAIFLFINVSALNDSYSTFEKDFAVKVEDKTTASETDKDTVKELKTKEETKKEDETSLDKNSQDSSKNTNSINTINKSNESDKSKASSTTINETKKNNNVKENTSNKTNTSKTEESKPVSEVSTKDTTKPSISGLSNKTIEFGSSFDSLNGVTATDDTDGNITHKISVSGSVNVQNQGTYKLTYKVSDKAGNTATGTRLITVKEKPVIIKNETALESQLFNAINDYRINNGVEPITFSNNQYSKANALAKSKAEANNKDSSHYANEISIVYGGGRPSASTLLNMWQSSPSHNDFLLNSRKHFGGCAIYSNGDTYYVILEGRIDDR